MVVGFLGPLGSSTGCIAETVTENRGGLAMLMSFTRSAAVESSRKSPQIALATSLPRPPLEEVRGTSSAATTSVAETLAVPGAAPGAVLQARISILGAFCAGEGAHLTREALHQRLLLLLHTAGPEHYLLPGPLLEMSWRQGPHDWQSWGQEAQDTTVDPAQHLQRIPTPQTRARGPLGLRRARRTATSPWPRRLKDRNESMAKEAEMVRKAEVKERRREHENHAKVLSRSRSFRDVSFLPAPSSVTFCPRACRCKHQAHRSLPRR